MSRYEDMIGLERPQSKHPQMSRHDRAAQFSPFAALTGYEDEIDEAGRLTDTRIALTDEQKDALDRKLQKVINDLQTGIKRELTVTYFIPDPFKAGGSFQMLSGTVKKIDLVNLTMLFENQQMFRLNDIVWIEENVEDEPVNDGI